MFPKSPEPAGALRKRRASLTGLRSKLGREEILYNRRVSAKPDLAVKHFDRLAELLEIEREAEKKENLRTLHKYPISTREALGKTVTGLVMTSAEPGIGGATLVTLTKAQGTEELAPFHAMGPGDNILLSVPGGMMTSCEGTLYKADEYKVTASIRTEPPDRLPSGCQIDLIGSEATYKQMKKALETVTSARKNRLSELRGIFLGDITALRGRKREIRYFNQGLNEYQRIAVASCLAAKDVALVHGPPGTGKTTVLVEVIRQAAASGERILATAPSNIAVDNILEKLLDSGLRVVRMGHPARTLESLRRGNLAFMVEEDPAYEEVRDLDAERERLVKSGSRHGRGRGQLGYDERHDRDKETRRLWREARDIEFEISRRIVASAQVVLATHAGIPRKLVKGEFDLAVLDEASQATEPLSWVPMTVARRAVFAGDSMQLPPTIYSPEAAKGGLATTLFERLKVILPSSLQTLLRLQYRMHEDIMGFSSTEFYEGRLIADESVRRHTASELPDVSTTDLTSAPLIFVDTAGAGFEESWNEMLESRENRGEAELAVRLMEKLLAAGIEPKKAAILTPYVAQAKLLKTMIKVPGLEIGSVDGFQGREKEATIVSLVRSNDDAEVGFLSDTRRMNVAMTRARRLLIMIGDSATLGRHPFYERFIDYAGTLKAHRSAYEWPAG